MDNVFRFRFRDAVFMRSPVETLSGGGDTAAHVKCACVNEIKHYNAYKYSTNILVSYNLTTYWLAFQYILVNFGGNCIVLGILALQDGG